MDATLDSITSYTSSPGLTAVWPAKETIPRCQRLRKPRRTRVSRGSNGPPVTGARGSSVAHQSRDARLGGTPSHPLAHAAQGTMARHAGLLPQRPSGQRRRQSLAARPPETHGSRGAQTAPLSRGHGDPVSHTDPGTRASLGRCPIHLHSQRKGQWLVPRGSSPSRAPSPSRERRAPLVGSVRGAAQDRIHQGSTKRHAGRCLWWPMCNGQEARCLESSISWLRDAPLEGEDTRASRERQPMSRFAQSTRDEAWAYRARGSVPHRSTSRGRDRPDPCPRSPPGPSRRSSPGRRRTRTRAHPTVHKGNGE
jgi:hypothetical protein